MESGDHSAYTMSENPPASMRGNSKPFNMSPNWKAESHKEATIKPKTNAFEPTKDSDKTPFSERHSSSQENGLSLAPRSGRPVKEDPSRPLADKMEKPSRHFQTGRGKGAHIESMENESRNPSHSSKHAFVKSFSFTGGARPKESQSQSSKHKTHTEHLLASSASIETKEDANKCSICLSKMKHPQTLPKCKHTFCKACLKKAVQQSPKCPYCREPLTDRQDSPTHGQGTNGYRGDEFAYSGLDRYGDDANDATLCLLCAKPVRNAKTLPCRHTFCGPCINKAFREYPACPCCSQLERNQPSTHFWNQDPYDQLFSNYPQGRMDMDVPQGRFPPAFPREKPRSNRGNRPPYAQNFDGYQEQFGFPGTTTRRGRPGRGTQPEGSMRDRQEKFSLPGYEEYETIVIQYSFNGGQQGPDHPNPGFRYESTSRSAYLPDCPEGRKVLKLLRKAFDAGLLFRIGRSMTSNLDNQIIWADIPHKTSTSGGQTKYGYPDPTYLSDVKQQLQAALNGR